MISACVFDSSARRPAGRPIASALRRSAAPLLLLVIGALSPVTRAQATDQNDLRADRAAMFERVQKIVGSMRSLGNWDDQYGMMMDSMERVYERQGWNSDSDRFSLDLVKTVESIPPWSVQERFDTTVRTLSDRYLLDEEQERSLRSRLLRLSNETFSKHSGRIMEYAVEAIQTRASGQPFTPEMVQRWATLAEPVFLDVRERLSVAAKEMAQELDPEQRAILEQDMIATQRRLSKVAEMGEGWKRGEWSAEQWGMEDDPIQNGAGLGAAAGSADPAATAKPATVNPRTIEAAPAPGTEPPAGEQPEEGQDAQPTDPAATPAQQQQPNQPRYAPPVQLTNDPWSNYVAAFIAKYSLTNDQTERAWQIFATVRTRRDEVQTKHDRRLAEVPAADAQSPAVDRLRTQHNGSLQRLFEQLSRRLEALPTRAQREAAKPGDLPNPLGLPAVAKAPARPAAAPPANPEPSGAQPAPPPPAAPK